MLDTGWKRTAAAGIAIDLAAGPAVHCRAALGVRSGLDVSSYGREQGRADRLDDGRFDLRSSRGDLFAAPARQVFLVKVNHWFDP